MAYTTTTQLQNFMGLNGTTDYNITQQQDALDRAEAEVDSMTFTHFSAGSAGVATPDYTQVTLERHTGKGGNMLWYQLKNYPLPEIETTSSSGTAINAGSAVIWCSSTNGFPSSGNILIESNKIAYTGKSTITFTGCSGVTAHGTSEPITPHVIEISMTDRGVVPEWQVLQKDRDFELDLSSGRVYLYESSIDATSTTTFSRYPSYQVPNRLRGSYLTGWSSIPLEITRLTLMLASKDLMHTVVRKATGGGLNDFNPSLVDVDDDWIDKTILKFKSERGTNI